VDSSGHKGLPAQLVLKVPVGPKAILVLKVFKELLDLKGLKETVAILAHLLLVAIHSHIQQTYLVLLSLIPELESSDGTIPPFLLPRTYT
jgi:hypothetical protein